MKMPLNPYELYNLSPVEEPPSSRYKCDICGETIYMYDKFYNFNDAIVCNNQECLDDYASSYLCEAYEEEFDYDTYDDYNDFED